MVTQSPAPLARARGSLRTKIVAWSFVPMVFMLTIVALFSYQTYQRVVETQVFQRNRELTRLLAQQLSAEVSDFSSVLAGLAAMPDIYRFQPDRQQMALEWSVNRLLDFDGGVAILNGTGQVTAADPRRPEARRQDWSARAYVQAMSRQRKGAIVSSAVPDGPDGTAALAVAVPVSGEDGGYRGQIVGFVRLDPAQVNALQQRIAAIIPGDARRMYVVDGDGRVLSHSDPRWTGADAGGQAPVQATLQAGRSGSAASGALRTTSLDGQEVLASYAPVPGTTWGLVVEENWGGLAAAYQGYLRELLALLALAVTVPAVVVGFGVRRITRPIAELSQAVEALGHGAEVRPIAVTSDDELAALARQFNRMSSDLKESYEQLEGRVAGRTRELATLNAISARVSRSLDVADICHIAVEETLAALGLSAGLAYACDAGEETFSLAAQRGFPDGATEPVARLPMQRALRGNPDGSPRLAALADWPAEPGDLANWVAAQGWQAAISLPLVANELLLGTMLLGMTASRALTVEELALLAAVGQQAGVALQNARLYAQAEQAAVAAERVRLARELHDSVTQTLFAANIIAGVLPAIWQRNQAAGLRRLEELRGLTQGALAEMRMLLLELRPAKLTETPLGDLLQQLAVAATARARCRSRSASRRLAHCRQRCRWRCTGSPRRRSTTWRSTPRPAGPRCACGRWTSRAPASH